MKIIQLIQKPQLRGAEIFACQLSQELKKLGHECILISVYSGDKVLPYADEVVSLDGSKVRRIWNWSAWKKLSEIVEREKPDIVQANAGDTLKYSVFSKLAFGWRQPIVFRNASTISLYMKSPFVRWWNKFLLQRTSHIISVSEFSKKDFVRTFPFSKERITVVPIGVKVHALNSVGTRTVDNLFFLHIGGFSFEKNHKGLISIFSRIKARYPAAKLGLVGDGPLRKEIETSVKEKGLQDSIIFYGYKSNPEEYLNRAHCFLLPSIIEGMPAVILESFLHKVPVVAYDVGGIPELVRPGETGWLVKRDDEEAFVAAVSDVIENSSRAIEFSKNAYTTVIKNFDLSGIAKRFCEVYQSIA